MNADMLHDAISQLPEELLAPVDSLRQKKLFHWQPAAAFAACVCLAAGLWLIAPAFSAKNSSGSAIGPEVGFGNSMLGSVADQITQESTSEYSLTVTVVEVSEDAFIAQPYGTEPVTVKLDELEQLPTLSPGQTVKLYCREIPDGTAPLVPYRIEIIEE